MSTETDRLSEKFSASFKVLVQLFPLRWDQILLRVEPLIDRGVAAASAMKGVDVLRGLSTPLRKAVLRALVIDRWEILRGQTSFHTPLTEVTLEDLLGGGAPGFFSFLPPDASGRAPTSAIDESLLATSGLIFISHHTGTEGPLANALVSVLERDGRTCWIAPRNTRKGNWNPQVLRAVHQCEVFIVLLSEEALNRPRVVGEVQIAVARNKPIVPVLVSPNIDPAEFDVGLQPVHAIPWIDKSVLEVENLANAIQLLLGDGAKRAA